MPFVFIKYNSTQMSSTQIFNQCNGKLLYGKFIAVTKFKMMIFNSAMALRFIRNTLLFK